MTKASANDVKHKAKPFSVLKVNQVYYILFFFEGEPAFIILEHIADYLKVDHITLLVTDIDEILEFHTFQCGVKRQDITFEGNRCTVSPNDQSELELLFVLANTEEKKAALGNRRENMFFMTLHTDDYKRDYQAMKTKSVKFCGQPNRCIIATLSSKTFTETSLA